MTVEKDSTADADILENESDKELDEILNGKTEEEKIETENKNEEKTYKLGTQTFKTFEEFNDAVQDMHGRNAKMASKIGELGYDPKTLTPKQKKEVEKAIEKEEKAEVKKEFDESDYYKFKAFDFQKSFPESKEYKEEISILVKKENCKVNGEPSYALAFARALLANGENIPPKLASLIRAERGGTSEEGKKEFVKTQKKIMSSGGTSSGMVDQQSYQSQEEIDSIGDFAKTL
jgi:hypothetical protein